MAANTPFVHACFSLALTDVPPHCGCKHISTLLCYRLLSMEWFITVSSSPGVHPRSCVVLPAPVPDPVPCCLHDYPALACQVSYRPCLHSTAQHTTHTTHHTRHTTQHNLSLTAIGHEHDCLSFLPPHPSYAVLAVSISHTNLSKRPWRLFDWYTPPAPSPLARLRPAPRQKAHLLHKPVTVQQCQKGRSTHPTREHHTRPHQCPPNQSWQTSPCRGSRGCAQRQPPHQDPRHALPVGARGVSQGQEGLVNYL